MNDTSRGTTVGAVAGRWPARVALGCEYAVLFFALPLAYYLGWVPVPLFVALWLLAAGCACVLLALRDFDRRRLWNADDLGRRLLRALVPFVVAAPFLLLATILFEPDRLFAFVRERPLLWALVMVLYPILSAYPQGVVYRAFVFHRYRSLFGGGWAMVLASAVAFSFVHIIFHNWIAPVLSFGGGVLFAWTYERTESSLAATVQHALFGCYLFTIGLGWYFYHGAVGS
jgi:membrane protease YdiL (CAAX protease family)